MRTSLAAVALCAGLTLALACSGDPSGPTPPPTSPEFVSSPGPAGVSISPSTDPVVFGTVTAPFLAVGAPTPVYLATPTTVTFTVTNTGTKPSGKISVSVTGSG